MGELFEMKIAEKLENAPIQDTLSGEAVEKLTGIPSHDKPHLKFYPEEALLENLPQNTMFGYMYEQNKTNMSNIAIIFDIGTSQKEITYKELFDNIDNLATNLIERGVGNNDKVAVCFANIPESVYVIYALNKIGAVACLIDPRITPKALERDLKELNVKMFIGIQEAYRSFIAANKKIGLKNYVFVSTLNSIDNKAIKILYNLKKVIEKSVPYGFDTKWKSICKCKNVKYQFPKYISDKLAIISYTGGTTGRHKGVCLSNDALNALVHSHKYIMGDVERGDCFMDILPQFMIYGIFSLHLALCTGLKTYLLIDPSPENFADNLIRLNPAVVFAGPVHWETLINNSKLKENCLSNMKAPVSGGEKLPLSKEKILDEVLISAGSRECMWNGYGASELGGSVTLKRGPYNAEGTVGRLHVFDNAKIVSLETGEELSYNEVGELYITTPSLMMGYYQREDEEKKAIVSDQYGIRWFATGDLARIDENGDIELTGRSKRLFVCGLNNVYPPEMEEIINSIPNVKSCVVVNVPDNVLREVPKVHIVLENDTDNNRAEIMKLVEKYISENIGREVLPRYYEFHKELLHTPSGKIDFDRIRKIDLEKMI